MDNRCHIIHGVLVLLATALLLSDRSAALPPKPNTSWLFIPMGFYTPETRIGAGLVSGYYFRETEDRRYNTLQGIALYTQNRQFTFAFVPEFYVRDGLWRVSVDARFRKFPDVFYGIGNDAALEEDYTDRQYLAVVSAQRRLRSGFYAGPVVSAAYTQASDYEPGGALESGVVPGSDAGSAVGAGLQITWDTRDNVFWTTTGHFAETSVIHYPEFAGDYAFTQVALDARSFHTFWSDHVVALRGLLSTTYGTAPFQLLPKLGGNEIMRGYREGAYRDKSLFAFQAEYRVRIWRRLSAVAFVGAGRTASSLLNLSPGGVHYNGGLGLRVRLNDVGVNLRLDFGFGQGERGFYVIGGEAF